MIKVLESDLLRQSLRKSFNPVVTNSLYSISKNFARKVTSGHNQHVSMMTVGGTGQGKSSSNIMLGINCALQVARYAGGKWTDYFGLNNIGILDRDEIYRVIEIDKKYAVIMPDDVGAAWNARKWSDAGNIMMNDIAQTTRTENQIALLTLPDSILIDKVPRVLCHYFMVMDNPQYDNGVSVGKFFRIVRMPLQDKTYFKYDDLGGLKYQKTLFARPPSFIMDEYEKKRYQIAHDLKQKAMAEKREAETAKNEPKEHKISKKERILELHRDVQAGIYPNIKAAIATEKNMKIDVQYARNVIYSCG